MTTRDEAKGGLPKVETPAEWEAKRQARLARETERFRMAARFAVEVFHERIAKGADPWDRGRLAAIFVCNDNLVEVANRDRRGEFVGFVTLLTPEAAELAALELREWGATVRPDRRNPAAAELCIPSPSAAQEPGATATLPELLARYEAAALARDEAVSRAAGGEPASGLLAADDRCVEARAQVADALERAEAILRVADALVEAAYPRELGRGDAFELLRAGESKGSDHLHHLYQLLKAHKEATPR